MTSLQIYLVLMGIVFGVYTLASALAMVALDDIKERFTAAFLFLIGSLMFAWTLSLP